MNQQVKGRLIEIYFHLILLIVSIYLAFIVDTFLFYAIVGMYQVLSNLMILLVEEELGRFRRYRVIYAMIPLLMLCITVFLWGLCFIFGEEICLLLFIYALFGLLYISPVIALFYLGLNIWEYYELHFDKKNH